MERLKRLALNLVMVHDRAVAGYDFRHGVGEVVSGAGVAFDNGAMRIRSDHDENARMSGLAGHAVIRNLNGLLDHGAVGNPDHGDVFQKRRVERDKRILIEHRQTAQVRARVFERAGLHAAGESRDMARRRAPLEAGARDGRHIGEAPFFVVGGGEAKQGEALEGPLAQFPRPRGNRRQGGEFRQPRAGLFGNGCHTLPTASSSSSIPNPA
jgi:hypothetical protein